MGAETSRSQALWYLLGIIAVLILALAGYVGYVLYPRFDLPGATGIGLLVLAAGAGIASFFSPCSFPLLASLLARETGAVEQRGQAGSRHSPSGRALGIGAALAIGAAVFLLLVGTAIALGATALFEGVTFTSTAGMMLRAIVGALLIFLGLIQLDVTPLSFRKADELALPLLREQASFRREHPLAGFGLLGFIYILAGFG